MPKLIMHCLLYTSPAVGALRLSELTAVDVQRLYNNLTNKRTNKPLSAKSKKNVHGTLHKALEKAVSLGYIRHNPADKPDLPKVQKAEIKPLADDEMISFLDVVKGCEYEAVYVTTLFTGMREGEVPVSYTHLDVYKRQALVFGVCL